MNLELNVVRFENDDVIATSDGYHYRFLGIEDTLEYVFKFNVDENDFIIDEVEDTSFTSLPDGVQFSGTDIVDFDSHLCKRSHVYVYKNGELVECEDDHFFYAQ